jgi:hypothetical protein
MSNIRIKDLTTTAATTASDDFVAVDGTTNGTRKLNAYSPTFGGNLTASGGSITVSGGAYPQFYANGTTGGGFTIRKSGVSYGTFYGNDSNTVLDSAGSASLILQTGGATRATLTSTATTLAGNLTVSGTGTSSFESTTPPTVAVQNTTSGLAGTQTGANGVLLGTLKFGHPSDAQSGNFPSIVGRFSLTDASFARCTALDFYTSSASGNARVGTFTELGNLLIGTTTDSANGKIQLTSHTTSAGGIGFGTETSVYRAAAGSLVVDHIGGSAPTLNLSANGAIQSRLFFNGTSTFLESYTSHSLILRTNQTTALTLDSSQNATFAGSIKTVAPSGGTAKPWELGEAATVSPTSPNRTIRVEIDGTVYYIHAKTTND